MKNFCYKNKIYIILVLATIGTLLIAIIEYYRNNEFIASICCNLFAGMITGCVIAFISALKNREKSKYNFLIIAYKSVYECLIEFINNKEYYKYLSNYDILFEEIYGKLSYLKFINDYIRKYKNEFLQYGELASIFIEKFEYNINDKEKEYIKLCEDLKEKVYNNEKELVKLVKKYEINVIKLCASIAIEIDKCKAEIYRIDQSFI